MDFLLLIPILLLSVVIHEVAHAWVARQEGDDTAHRLGRITLNPLPHLDPVGSFLVPLALYLLPGGVIFGWARPVPVNPANFRDPVGGDIRVSLAGIVSNLLLAGLFTGLLWGVGSLGGGGGGWGAVETMARYGILINLILAFFNLIPLPPLDGSHVVAHLLPRQLRVRYRGMGRYGLLILMAVVFVVPGVLMALLTPVWSLYGMALRVAGVQG